MLLTETVSPPPVEEERRREGDGRREATEAEERESLRRYRAERRRLGTKWKRRTATYCDAVVSDAASNAKTASSGGAKRVKEGVLRSEILRSEVEMALAMRE